MADTRETVSQVRDKLTKAQARIEKVKKEAQVAMGHALQTVEVGGTAFALAYARGRMGTVDEETGQIELNLLGIPVGVVGGVAMHGLAFAGALGEYSEHAHNIGDGMIAEYAAITGFRIGGRHANDAHAEDPAVGRPPPAIAGRVGRSPGYQPVKMHGAAAPKWGNPAAAYARRY